MLSVKYMSIKKDLCKAETTEINIKKKDASMYFNLICESNDISVYWEIVLFHKQWKQNWPLLSLPTKVFPYELHFKQHLYENIV